jgi:hypothetical protein
MIVIMIASGNGLPTCEFQSTPYFSHGPINRL